MKKTRSNLRMPTECPEQIRSVLTSLAISADLNAARSLVLHPQAQGVVVAAIGDDGREYLLTPAAGAEWGGMRGAAPARRGVVPGRSAAPRNQPSNEGKRR